MTKGPPRREFSQAVHHAALMRAQFRCEQCGRKEQLELHHVGHRADRSLFNARILCAACHARYHADRRRRGIDK